MKRRQFLAASALAAAGIGAGFGFAAKSARAQSKPRLQMPPLLDTRTTGRLPLTARTGSLKVFDGPATPTAGFNQGYLGPTVIVRNGAIEARIDNELAEPVSVHWHGLMVSGEQDGGPHQPVASGGSWKPELNIAQPPATAWYHTHIHERTAAQVYSGLAGVLHVSDGRDDERGLPASYGVDDLTLVLQDRRVAGSGSIVYEPSMMDVMHGFLGNWMLVNGQAGTVATVPKGVVRLRLLNGSNAREYLLAFDDGRPMHLIATDSGYLSAPVVLQSINLAPGERIEILVDLSDGATPVLISGAGQSFAVQEFATDDRLPVRITRVPDVLDDELEDLSGKEIRTRQVSLDMGMGGMMMRGASFGINGRAFDMDRIDFEVALGSIERWVVTSAMMSHPFHVHGVRFQVVRENGSAPRPENRGWKDTVYVPGEAEIIARFDQPAPRDKPFMFHCHILEHEDAGMMGQFTVT